ncbi:MAG: 5-bromo-4-chloroindolyl phosphate hydrolysis family protein [Acetivibrionales bacterium]
MKISTTGRILSIAAGVAVFALLLFLIRTLTIPLVAGVLGWLVVILYFLNKEKKDALVAEGLTRSDLEETIKTGRKLTGGMRQAIKRLSQLDICNEVEDLCRIAESMFDLLRKDPKDIRIVKQFVTYYLEPTHKIIIKYVELATTRPMPLDAIETLERTEKSLKGIRTTFLQQKEKMLTNDVIDLDTEIKVFETLAGNYGTTSVKKDKDNAAQTKNGI